MMNWSRLAEPVGAIPTPTPARHRRAIIALIVLCQSSQSLVTAGMALFLPLIRHDLHLTFAQAGMFAVASTATYAAMQIPSGYLADRFGARRSYVLGVLGVNAMSFAIAVLPNFASLLVAQGVCGIFRALMFAPGMVLITAQFRTDRRATAMGMFVAFGFSSNIFLNVLGPILVGQLGWRRLFAIFAGVGLSFLALYLRLSPRHDDGIPTSRSTKQGLIAAMRHKLLWICGGIQFVRLAVTLATATWWPTYLVSQKGMSLRTAGLVLAVGAVLTAPANLVGGYVSDRYARPLTVIVSSLVVVSCTLILTVQLTNLSALILTISVNQLFLQVYFGPLFEIPIKAMGGQFAGSISGFSNMCANVGGLTAIYLLGALRGWFGTFDVGIYGLAGLCGVSLLLVCLLRRKLTAAAEIPAAAVRTEGVS